MPADNIHTEFHRILGRSDREKLLGQRGLAIWLYGLSGSGKTTVASLVEKDLHARGLFTALLDGDNLRTGLNAGLGFSDEDRHENIRRASETVKLFVHSGIVTFASFITPKRSLRTMARHIVGADDFLEVFASADFAECSRRDVKGLYAKAQNQNLPSFTGKDSPFEGPEPEDNAFTLNTGTEPPERSAERLLEIILPRIKYHHT